MTTGHTSSTRPPLLLLVPLLGLLGFLVGWACGTCGGGGVASDGATCPDCNGHGHT